MKRNNNNVDPVDYDVLVFVSRTEEHYRQPNGKRYIVKIKEIPRQRNKYFRYKNHTKIYDEEF